MKDREGNMSDGISSEENVPARTIGLTGATAVGVGAIVGGGILVLAGTAFERAGPGAILAFGFNGMIALITAMSFAELSTTFPQSGGAYQFAKKVFSMRAAFAMGWILWFAYIVAAVLYALGFGAYAAAAIWQLQGHSRPEGIPGWWGPLLGTVATVVYATSLSRKATGGGHWATWGKVLVFLVLIAAGARAIFVRPLTETSLALSPFLPRGPVGVLQAMGYTFIAMQGFELVSTVAGEVKMPMRNIPRAMFLSLGAALLVYIPFLVVVSAAGVPAGDNIMALAAREPDTVMATAARNFMGEAGYWFVMVAAFLATLTALQACILAASRVAQVMAVDRALPRALSVLHPARNTPVAGVAASAGLILVLCYAIPSPGAAGAASSLIFLLSFALAHGSCILIRVRSGGRSDGFMTPGFPAFPLAGGVACVVLAVFQGIAVPAAGLVTILWLLIGFGLYLRLFALRAEAIDAFASARNPALMRLRGLRPLVLAPIANPESAHNLVAVAHALAPPESGQVMLLNVVINPEGGADGASSNAAPLTRTTLSIRQGGGEALMSRIDAAQSIVKQTLSTSLRCGWTPQTLMTIASEPWGEIRRVAKEEKCSVLLLGFSHIRADGQLDALESLLSSVDGDVAVLCAPGDWRLQSVRKVLVPLGGKGGNDRLRAQLLGSLYRTGVRDIDFVQVAPMDVAAEHVGALRRELEAIANEEVPTGRAVVLQSNDVAGALLKRAGECDLVIMGLTRDGARRRSFGSVALRVATETSSPMLAISRGR